MQLRRAGPSDAATILRFIRELAEYEKEPDAVQVDEATLRAQLSASEPPFECVIAQLEVDDGDGRAQRPVGFALFFHTYSTWRGRRGLYLEDLYVSPRARGRGVGRALLAELARLAVERGCARMEWSVLDWNELAIGFYQELGARPMRGWSTWRLQGAALDALAGPR